MTSALLPWIHQIWQIRQSRNDIQTFSPAPGNTYWQKFKMINAFGLWINTTQCYHVINFNKPLWFETHGGRLNLEQSVHNTMIILSWYSFYILKIKTICSIETFYIQTWWPYRCSVCKIPSFEIHIWGTWPMMTFLLWQLRSSFQGYYELLTPSCDIISRKMNSISSVNQSSTSPSYS